MSNVYSVHPLADFYNQDIENLPAAQPMTRQQIVDYIMQDPTHRGIIVNGMSIWNCTEDPDALEGRWCLQDLPLECPDADQYNTLQEALSEAGI